MLNDELLGGLRGWRHLCLINLLLLDLTRLLMCLYLKFSLLFLAGLVTKLVTAKVLALVPATAADARSTHHANRHLNVAAILFVESFNFLEPLDFKIKCVYFLHQLTLSCAALNCYPLQVVR